MTTNDVRLPARPSADHLASGAFDGALPPRERPDRWLTVEESAAQFFVQFDGNSDGTITVSEIVAALHPNGKEDAPLNGVVRRLVDLMDPDDDGDLVADDVTAALEKLDSNDDGTLTPADLGREMAHEGLTPVLAFMLHGGPPRPKPTPLEIQDVVLSILARFDGDDNGALTLTELLAELDPRGHRQKLQDVLTNLVGAVDTNGDGAMSEAELTVAVTSLDANGDARLDHGDHVPGPGSADDIDLVGVLLPKFRHFDGAGPEGT